MISRNTEYLLLETIRQVGVSNYSLIARLTGLSAETVRYKVNKQLSKMGLGILINIDYAQPRLLHGHANGVSESKRRQIMAGQGELPDAPEQRHGCRKIRLSLRDSIPL